METRVTVKEQVNDANFLLYCAKHYNSRISTSDREFLADIDRLKYIKKLITRYTKTGVLKERLILNHVIILSNVFTPSVCTKIILFKLREQDKYIKPFLVFLDILPPAIYNIGDTEILLTDTIDMDSGIVEALRKI